MEIESKQYIDFKVYSVTTIKKKYGFRIALIYEDNSKKIIQKAGYKTKKEANSAREIVITELHTNTFIVHDNINAKDFLHIG